MSFRGRPWAKEKQKQLKQKKKELKERIKKATNENEKVQLAKQVLGDAYNKYKGFIDLIPEVEERIKEIENDIKAGTKDTLVPSSPETKVTLIQEELREKLKLWKNVLTNLEHVRDRPKAMKVYYSKKVLKQIKIIKEKYPG